jgi:protein SCO1/2
MRAAFYARGVTENASPQSRLKQARILLWALVALAVIGIAVLFVVKTYAPGAGDVATVESSFGGPFTLVGADGRPFSSAKLAGEPYAIYFGFTRCGDVCPTTLSRLVQLRKQAGGEDKFRIVFVTIDPANDGPKEVGQYAGLFNSPIIGLTGSQAQIDHVKKQYGIFAQPMPHAAMGKQFEHTATVLLFDRGGHFVGTITPTESDASALATLKPLTA